MDHAAPSGWRGVVAVARRGRASAASKTFVVRIVRQERDDWQGQLVDVASGRVHPFASFLQFQRLLLGLTGEGQDGRAASLTEAPTLAGGAGLGA